MTAGFSVAAMARALVAPGPVGTAAAGAFSVW